MHSALKVGLGAGVGVAALEYLYTTSWYQSSQFAAVGGWTGILFDMTVAGTVAVGVGMVLGGGKG